MSHICCFAASALLAAIVVFTGSRAEFLAPEALYEIKGGPNCATSTPHDSECMECVENPPDYSEECLQNQTGSACVAYVGLGMLDCQTQSPFCGGQAWRWETAGCPGGLPDEVVPCEKRYPATDMSGSAPAAGSCP